MLFRSTGCYTILIIALVLSMPIVPYIQNKYCRAILGKNVESLVGAAIFLVSVLMCISGSYNPFIYFNF